MRSRSSTPVPVLTKCFHLPSIEQIAKYLDAKNEKSELKFLSPPLIEQVLLSMYYREDVHTIRRRVDPFNVLTDDDIRALIALFFRDSHIGKSIQSLFGDDYGAQETDSVPAPTGGKASERADKKYNSGVRPGSARKKAGGRQDNP